MAPSSNKIIAALLDIADAARAVAETADTHVIGDGSDKRIGVVDFDALGTLAERLWRLSSIPRKPGKMVNPPGRAREALRALLEDEHMVGEVVTFAADVQRDGIEFHTQPWRAPVESPQQERRLRERMIEATIPAEKCEDPVVEANRQLLLARSRLGVSKYGKTLADASLSRAALLQHALEEALDLSNYLQAELQRNRIEQDELRTTMLADTADEAHKIINDAGLLANLLELFKMRDPGTTIRIRESTGGTPPWSISVEDGDATRIYHSTSMHQAIVTAHKGERDYEYPEHEECQFCGLTVEVPCDAPPPAECDTALSALIPKLNKPK